MIAFTSDQWEPSWPWFVLGLLVGAFLFAGSGRKWKNRYRTESERRETVQREHAERNRAFEDREKEWREQDSLRAAAIKDRRDDGIHRQLSWQSQRFSVGGDPLLDDRRDPARAIWSRGRCRNGRRPWRGGSASASPAGRSRCRARPWSGRCR